MIFDAYGNSIEANPIPVALPADSYEARMTDFWRLPLFNGATNPEIEESTTMTEVEFKGFSKIPRLNRLVIATEKIDGTNGIVHVSEDGAVLAGSRNRWITPEKDNMGFARWVQEHADELRALGPGYHFGEWFGQGIQRKYGLTEKRWALFNIHRWADDAVRPKCCHVVPVLATGMDIRAVTESALDLLRTEGSRAVPGFMKPEGVVVYHTASGHLYKVTLEGDEAPKGKLAEGLK